MNRRPDDDDARGGDPSGRAKAGQYRLTVPLDASAVVRQEREAPSDDCCDEPVPPEQVQVKVAVRDPAGRVRSQVVRMDAEGRGAATLDFEEQPGVLQVTVGPGDATDAELPMLQTLQFQVSRRQWADRAELVLPPLLVPPFYWFWWLRWCRTFVVRGRVVCPDGSPVPGAQVCAYDVDWFFIWSSTQLAGCTTTDLDGTFELRFRWCCGWWPWAWWRLRRWSLNPFLGARVGELLERTPSLRLGTIAGQQPALDVFEPIASVGGASALERVLRTDPGVLDRLRERLVERLPAAPELARLRIWPWWPWHPWRDCAPDLIFKVTQACVGGVETIVDEDVGDTRVNATSPLTVTLVSGVEACCLRPRCPPNEPCDEGECLVVDRVCGIALEEVGGNLGAPPTPVGYALPGPVPPGTANGHRPFAGLVPVYKNPGDLLGVDYLEFEVSDDGGATWGPLPVGAGVDFQRRYWEAATSPPSVAADFKFDATSFPGHTVLETREHREAAIGGTWDSPGADRWWLSLNWELLLAIDSERFADGTYRFRAIGSRDGGGGTLVDRRVLPVCGTEQENDLVLTFDNQVVTVPGLHPVAHHCGAGIHFCTEEPDTHILAVRIDGVAVGPCDTVDAADGTLEIDFLVRDSATVAGQPGHLASYVLESRWGLSLSRNLLSQPSAAVTTLAGGPDGWAPGQTTGNYGRALAQGAVAPDWAGGTFRLTMLVAEAFPEPCCYQLYLEASKRTIVGGGGGSGPFSCSGTHWNRTQYAIGVGVCGRETEERAAVAAERAAVPAARERQG